MSALFEELDYAPTPIGALSLRRRFDLRLGREIFEVILGEEHLMSSVFTASEIALGQLGVAACQTEDEGEGLDIVVGGLGLGYTAQAVLESPRIASLRVIEFLEPVIGWHRDAILPLGRALVDDARCTLVADDFFALARGSAGFDADRSGRRFDAVLVDIDHTPDALLDTRSAAFYTAEGLHALARHLKPGGVFGLWSDAVTDPAFVDRLGTVFATTWAEPVTFHNPYQDRPFTQTVYLARTAAS